MKAVAALICSFLCLSLGGFVGYAIGYQDSNFDSEPIINQQCLLINSLIDTANIQSDFINDYCGMGEVISFNITKLECNGGME